MGRLLVRSYTISADGYGAGPRQTLETPLGEGGEELHEWMVTTRHFNELYGGEGGTTPALAVVVNAVVDALSEFGVTHLEMPLTAEKVWRAIQNGGARP